MKYMNPFAEEVAEGHMAHNHQQDPYPSEHINVDHSVFFSHFWSTLFLLHLIPLSSDLAVLQ